MNATVDTLYAQMAASFQKKAGDADGLPRPAPPLAVPPKDPAAIAVTPDGGEIKPVVNPGDVTAAAPNIVSPFAGQLANVASGKSNMLSQLDISSIEPLLNQGKFTELGLDKALPTKGVDQMTPQQLAAAMRTHMAVSQTPGLAQRLANQRIFANPMNEDAKANLDLDAVRGMYAQREGAFSADERTAYESALYPGGVQGSVEKGLVGAFAPKKLQEAVGQKSTELKQALEKVETDPAGTGFQDWFTESWGNIAVPAGMLLMMFGGDTGQLLGGLAVAAGGYDLYNRYNTLTKDPAAQTAISQFIKGGMSKQALEQVRESFGDRYAKAALDFMAASRYGFLSSVQGKYRDAGVQAYKSLLPGSSEQAVSDFGKTLPGATPDANAWSSDWANKAWQTGKGWLAGTPAATSAAVK